MKREHALRYLLLRHMKAVQPRVPAAAFDEVTRSLRVAKDDESYVVDWTRDGQGRQRRFPAHAFSFYQRGDTDPESRTVEENLRTPNDAAARQFAGDVFALAPLDLPQPETAKARVTPSDLIGHAACVALLVALGWLEAAAGVVLVAMAGVEFVHHGRLYASMLFVVLAFVAPGPAITGGCAYAALQFLDPDPRLRTLRLVVSLAAAVAGAFVTGAAGIGGLTVAPLAAAIVAAVLVAAGRSLIASHRRALPLAMPFLWAGFVIDDMAGLAFAGIVLTAAGALAAAVSSRMKLRHATAAPRMTVAAAPAAATAVKFHARRP